MSRNNHASATAKKNPKTLPLKEGVTKPMGTSYKLEKVLNGVSDGRFGKLFLFKNANNFACNPQSISAIVAFGQDMKEHNYNKKKQVQFGCTLYSRCHDFGRGRVFHGGLWLSETRRP